MKLVSNERYKCSLGVVALVMLDAVACACNPATWSLGVWMIT